MDVGDLWYRRLHFENRVRGEDACYVTVGIHKRKVKGSRVALDRVRKDREAIRIARQSCAAPVTRDSIRGCHLPYSDHQPPSSNKTLPVWDSVRRFFVGLPRTTKKLQVHAFVDQLSCYCQCDIHLVPAVLLCRTCKRLEADEELGEKGV